MPDLNLNLDKIKLNIGKLLPKSSVSGPGNRFVIWVQGCSLGCPQCINQQFLSHDPKRIMPISEVYEIIASIPDIEGVTYSGGEPFEQAEALYYLSKLLKRDGLTIMSYSGYTYDEIINCNDRHISNLLSTLDILVDGRFEAKVAVPLLWRGSKNQNIYFFTDKYRHYKTTINREGIEMELSINDKVISFTGNFDKDLLRNIVEKLRDNCGIVLK